MGGTSLVLAGGGWVWCAGGGARGGVGVWVVGSWVGRVAEMEGVAVFALRALFGVVVVGGYAG